eukprot:9601441-Ditylum_brightwellii.AAC.1
MAIYEAESDPRPKTFHQYIGTLAKWKQQLLLNVEFIMEEEDVINILSEILSLYLVSDKGKESGLGQFGWLIGTYTESFVQNKGHTAGNPNLIKSLHTESVGALLLLLFILHFCTYHNLKPNTDLWTHFYDNNTVIQRIQYSQLRTLLTPTSTLHANFDVKLQIEAAIKPLS